MKNTNKYHNGNSVYYYDSDGEMRYGIIFSMREYKGMAEVMVSTKMGLKSEIELSKLWPTEKDCIAAKRDELMESITDVKDLVGLMLKHGKWEGLGEVIKDVAEIKLEELNGKDIKLPDPFKPHEVWVTEEWKHKLPSQLEKHIDNGGSIYMISAPKDGFCELSSEINGEYEAYANMKYVAQEVSLTENGLKWLPKDMRMRYMEGDPLYMVGESQNGMVTVAAIPALHGNLQWMILTEDAKVKDHEQDFADAVVNIQTPDDAMEQ